MKMGKRYHVFQPVIVAWLLAYVSVGPPTWLDHDGAGDEKRKDPPDQAGLYLKCLFLVLSKFFFRQNSLLNKLV